jgi:uncharacterized protein (DUF488 family)
MRNEAPTSRPAEGCRVLSVGHSHHDLPRLVELLRAAAVDAVADVRSSPFSRRLPQFNRPELEAALKAAGVAYVFLGDLLGGRPPQQALYDDEGRVDYRRVRATDFFRRGLERLERAQRKCRVAMLCAEEDPLDCHRGLMIAPALVERRIAPAHLRGDGRIETTAALEDRLLAVTGLDGLFALTEEDRREALEAAYDAMARKKAFRQRPDGGAASPQDEDPCEDLG